MVFEVDNTTEKLISELQSGIRSVIEDLERSQHEIKELLETLKLSCSDLATADQADAVGEDIAKVKSTLLKLATADQIKKYEDSFVTLLNGQTKSSALMIEVRNEVQALSATNQKQAESVISSQSEIAKHFENLLNEQRVADAKGRMEGLQTVANQLQSISEQLASKMDMLSQETQNMLTTTQENKAVLIAIANYLSLPGYKRFFKGMEDVFGESTQ